MYIIYLGIFKGNREETMVVRRLFESTLIYNIYYTPLSVMVATIPTNS